MCGIGGILLLDKRKKMDKETQIQSISLLHELEDRGEHAWGMYLKKVGKNKNLYCGKEIKDLDGEIFKTDGSVTEFFTNNNTKVDLNGVNTLLMHTRHYTKGDPKYNENNHPFNTKNFILSHNGGISNDDEIKKKFNIDTKIKCDSYIIVHLIQHFYDKNDGDVIKAIESTISELSGGFACWLYYKDDKTVYLFRSTNPLSYFYDEKNSKFYFASTSMPINRSIQGINSRDIDELDTGKIFKITKSGLKKVGKFEEYSYNRGNSYNYNNYSTNNKSSTKRSPIDINLNKIDNSLVYLYEQFEKYETDGKIRTVIALTNHSVVIMAKPKELVEKLEAAGFGNKKDKNSVGDKDKYCKYIINPPEDINKLVENLKLNSGDANLNVKDKKEIDSIRKEIEAMSNKDVEEEFFSKIYNNCDILELEFNVRGSKMYIESQDSPVPDYILELFKIIGKPMSPKTGKLSMKVSNKHMRDLMVFIRLIEEDLDNE